MGWVFTTINKEANGTNRYGLTIIRARGRVGKSGDEIAAFKEFAQICGLDIDLVSVRSCNPPEPDINCRVDGSPRYFELGRLLDPGIPRLRILAMRQAPAPVRVDPAEFGVPERDMLQRKLAKSYSTQGVPVDLILFYDWADALTHSAPPPCDLNEEFIKSVIMPELSRGTGPFERIWIYERIRPSVLWKYPS